MKRFILIHILAISLTGVLPDFAHGIPKPKQQTSHEDMDILGFNDGVPYRIEGPSAEAVLRDPGAVIFRFTSKDWMDRTGEGTYVSVDELTGRFPNRSPTELIAVFGVDLDADRVTEMVLVPDNEALGSAHRYAPTVLNVGTKEGYTALWAADRLPGDRFRVVDIRDLNADGRPEILFTGRAGRTGYYQHHELVGLSPTGFQRLTLRHVDSIHYVDLNNDRKIEVVVRECVGRRGPAYQWTYVDHLSHWNGQDFIPVDHLYPRYHDEQTLPTLISDLIDNFDAKLPIQEEKVQAIRKVRAEVLSLMKKPRNLKPRLLPALSALQKGRLPLAKRKLEEIQRQYPYEVQVQTGLAKVYAAEGKWGQVLDYAIRTLTIDPRSRDGWWWAGMAFSQLEERSSAVASFHNLVRLSGTKEDGVAFLRTRRGEPGMEANLQNVIDQALAGLQND